MRLACRAPAIGQWQNQIPDKGNAPYRHGQHLREEAITKTERLQWKQAAPTKAQHPKVAYRTGYVHHRSMQWQMAAASARLLQSASH